MFPVTLDVSPSPSISHSSFYLQIIHKKNL